MTTREEEMALLKKRYMQTRGQSVPEVEKLNANKTVIIKKQKKSSADIYINLMKNDLRKIVGLKPVGIKKKEKPLDLSWLEKKGGKFF